MGVGQVSLKETSPEKEEIVKNRPGEELIEGIKLFDESKYIEAIAYFSYYSKLGNLVAHQYMARAFLRLQNYEVAYSHFEHLANEGGEKYSEYGKSMVAAIEIIWGNFGKAIKTLKSLPSSPRNLINLSLLYWKKYKVQRDEFSIREALKILNKLDTFTLPQFSVRQIYHLKGLIYQAQKDYRLSESFYKQAVNLSENDVARGQILNDFASLYIDTKNYDLAETLLKEARECVIGKSELEEAFNNKWMGILAMKRRMYEVAKEYLQNAIKIIREKELIRELAGLVFLLAELSKEEGFYKAADHYAEGIALEKLLDEGNESDEKIIKFYFDSFFGDIGPASPG